MKTGVIKNLLLFCIAVSSDITNILYLFIKAHCSHFFRSIDIYAVK